MIEVDSAGPGDAEAASDALRLFQKQWAVYRKVVDHNYMQHREVYARLHEMLVVEAVQPFRFIDIACGDASASVGALLDTRVEQYHGIDLSGPALGLARIALSQLGCPFSLEERDFAVALRERTETAHVAWLGQSLHHLSAGGKRAVMRDIRRLLDGGGLFLLWEPTRFDGEARDTWFHRMETRCRPWWTALTPDEWDAMATHTRIADFPETVSGWLELGHDAGFRDGTELMQAPSDLGRVYCFRV